MLNKKINILKTLMLVCAVAGAETSSHHVKKTSKKINVKTSAKTPMVKAFDNDDTKTMKWCDTDFTSSKGMDSFNYMIGALKYNKYVVTFNFKNNKLNAKQLEKVISALSKKDTIRTIDFTGINFTGNKLNLLNLIAANENIEMITLDKKGFGKKEINVINALEHSGIVVVWNK